MRMRIKPRYLILAALAAGGLYALGVSAGTLMVLLALAYMAFMHLGHGVGHGPGAGGHSGGCRGHAPSKSAYDTTETPSRQQPRAGTGDVGHH